MQAAANDREAFADALKTLTVPDAGSLLVAALEVAGCLIRTSDKALAQGEVITVSADAHDPARRRMGSPSGRDDGLHDRLL